jgi:hypothetical protein
MTQEGPKSNRAQNTTLYTTMLSEFQHIIPDKFSRVRIGRISQQITLKRSHWPLSRRSHRRRRALGRCRRRRRHHRRRRRRRDRRSRSRDRRCEGLRHRHRRRT